MVQGTSVEDRENRGAVVGHRVLGPIEEVVEDEEVRAAVVLRLRAAEHQDVVIVDRALDRLMPIAFDLPTVMKSSSIDVDLDGPSPLITLRSTGMPSSSTTMQRQRAS